MAKQDAEVPDQVPAKRRPLESAPDHWIAVWLTRDLSPSQRKRVEEEKQRRKELRAREERVVGLLVGYEGATPEQIDIIAGMLEGATAIHFPTLPKRLYAIVKDVPNAEVHIHRHWDAQEAMKGVIRASRLVIGAPRGAKPEGTGVWEMIRYAKHRRLPVRVVLPDGTEGESGA